ncbi:virulence-associated protein e [[Clostridium] sordellii]|uniref:Virulence-associated E family protein n=1 Tax=Paraclostridium sordellii TaxID=1505 RepID=A0ABM9RNJ2_PARSO|nr:virulence-associated E family protein [Paeniclostridium sordellii]CEJ73604.1 virulence-associated E family protein [[Clostridium] sordellii] [Paeniclostridium sordellii]CEN69152.1 virulence-associated protein e [[Clostridium] sordellii] [Paeniclostridium sordellii]CEN72420.1 virulence-associated protein e [[Clostridium] sordellii] [Paeniclostridium sordellii]CEO23840.1 virulence-associated protein e [[Clostridium] sordellii] [Paeniclostridium sordellii]CEP75987.1 virulence-associated protei
MKHDKLINIAIGRSRKEINYVNKSISYSDFINNYLKDTKYTKEDYKEYINFSKDIQDNIKDVGGFVDGFLKDGKRRKETVINRSLVTLDADFAYENMIEDIEKNCDFAMCIYTTHKHTKENPRFRIVIPLSYEVDSIEYEAIARKLAFNIGIDYFDDTTYSPSRLMYFPSTSKDGDYVFKIIDKAWLNPKDILNSYENYKDESSWPFSSRTKGKVINSNTNTPKENPRLKEGIIGAFCRVYNVFDVIEKYLSNIYKKGDSDYRYTYINGSSSNGLIIYENGDFAYSHHSTDVCLDKLCNSFDLLRLHKFSNLDEKVSVDTPINKLPSYINMIEFISKDEKVMLELGNSKLKQAKEDFKDLYNVNEDNIINNDNIWITKLEVDKKGMYKASNKNIVTILENDINLKGKIAYNLFSNRTMVKGDLPWRSVSDKVRGDIWQDSDDANLRVYIDITYGIVAPYKINDGLAIIEKKNKYHPIIDYLNSNTWDKISRVDTLMIDYLGAEDCEYTKSITRKMLVAAVSRVFNPGIKFDYMLVLVGRQGIGKSYIINLLGREWYSDSLNTVYGKEAYEQLQNAWILEMAELSATKKADAEAIKHFISKTEDSYRQAYGKRVDTFKRQCVFFGTTNENEFLKDRTGNRRYWPLMVGVNKPLKNLFKDLNKNEINQIWAEALYLYKCGEKLILEGEVEREATLKQEQHLESNSKEGMIREFLNMKLPKSWDKMDVFERRIYIGEGNGLREEGCIIRDKVCSAEIWVELFGGDMKMFYKGNAREINDILRKIDGWSALKNGAGKLRFGKIYGVQRAFIRDN